MSAIQAPIGVFDSGLGGLSILREIHRQLPAESTVYFADQAHVPYGPRTLLEVQRLSETISVALLKLSCKMVVVACNTASAAALHHLRDKFPDVPFVGMEPAVKPAAELSLSRRAAVLATPATFQGELFASVVERFAGDMQLLEVVLPGLVEQIELGQADSPESQRILETGLAALKEAGVDTLVLACTHYAFTIPLLQQIMGPSVQVIDPAPAIARQAQRVLEQRGLLANPEPAASRRYLTSGDPAAFTAGAIRLLGEELQVEQATWADGDLEL